MTATDIMPTDSAELEEMLHDGKKMKELIGDPARHKEFLTNFARAVNKTDKGIRQQITDGIQREFARIMRENDMDKVFRPDLSPIDSDGMPKKLPDYKLYNKHAKGAALDKVFTGLGDFFGTIYKNGDSRHGQPEKLAQLKNAFGSEVPGDGGFLIPEVLRANLLRVALETAVVRPRALVLPMENPRVPFPAIDSTTNVGSVYGGVTGYWTREGAALTPSSANFGRVILDAKKLTAYAEVPNELIQDSIIAFEAFLSQIFPEALAFFEDIKFIGGSGVDEPLGVLNSPASVTVNKESGQPTKTITWNNIVQMYARILPSSLGRAVWLASIDTFPELATMSLPVGTGGSAVWIGNLQQPGAMAPPMTILGRPVVFTEKASVLGTQGDITLTDFSYYLIGDRQTMTAADSADYKFANDLTAFRFVERLDGQPWLLNSITPANGGPALSSIVQLQTR